jgi:hypothetical protein
MTSDGFRYHTMTTLRGSETLLCDSANGDNAVATFHGDGHADLAERVAGLLNVDADVVYAVVPEPATVPLQKQP